MKSSEGFSCEEPPLMTRLHPGCGHVVCSPGWVLHLDQVFSVEQEQSQGPVGGLRSSVVQNKDLHIQAGGLSPGQMHLMKEHNTA